MSRQPFEGRVEMDTLQRALNMIDRSIAPAIMADVLNQSADAVAKRTQRNARSRLTVRKSATISRIRQDRHARGDNIDRMYARTQMGLEYIARINAGVTVTPESGTRVPIPTVAARTGRSETRSIARRFNLRQIGSVGSSETFFVGRPKGGNRPVGLWFRHHRNRRLSLIRRLEHSRVIVKGRHFFDDAVQQFATPQYIQSNFIRIARQRLREIETRGR